MHAIALERTNPTLDFKGEKIKTENYLWSFINCMNKTKAAMNFTGKTCQHNNRLISCADEK